MSSFSITPSSIDFDAMMTPVGSAAWLTWRLSPRVASTWQVSQSEFILRFHTELLSARLNAGDFSGRKSFFKKTERLSVYELLWKSKRFLWKSRISKSRELQLYVQYKNMLGHGLIKNIKIARLLTSLVSKFDGVKWQLSLYSPWSIRQNVNRPSKLPSEAQNREMLLVVTFSTCDPLVGGRWWGRIPQDSRHILETNVPRASLRDGFRAFLPGREILD